MSRRSPGSSNVRERQSRERSGVRNTVYESFLLTRVHLSSAAVGLLWRRSAGVCVEERPLGQDRALSEVPRERLAGVAAGPSKRAASAGPPPPPLRPWRPSPGGQPAPPPPWAGRRTHDGAWPDSPESCKGPGSACRVAGP
ncbi:hypothetical protein HPB47_019700 [Ixodes persulcatus]|uniref:Uncharacterized protein n=1 Tax=Ixodes persulcatus TaxID=34615 RepID=A0AC60QKZ6_IXOPE|nr:hypothetical protein HPB47_019700 [Ixodes persulcatus]